MEVENEDTTTGVTSYSSTCVACESPCLECMTYPTTCVSCVSDEYRLNGTSCFKKLVVGIEIRIDIVYALFISSGQVQTIITILYARMSIVLIVTFTKEGSAIVGFALSPTDTTSGTATASTVDSMIEDGSLGVPIIASSVGLYYEDEVYVEDTNGSSDSLSIGLIIGLVVGAVLLAVVTGILIYKYKKRNSNQVHSET